MSCLIIKNDGVGDLILASGLISSVGKFFDGDVDLVTCGDNREIAEGIGPLRERFYVSRDGMHFSGLAAKMGRLIPRISREDRAILQIIASRRYKLVICLRRFIRQSSLILMGKVYGDRKYCAWEYPTNATKRMADLFSQGWQHIIPSSNILSELSYAKAFLENVLNTEIKAQPELSFCRKQTNPPNRRIIALGIGGGSTNWPKGHWVELAVSLADGGYRLVLLGGSNVAGLARAIANRVPDAKNLVGRCTWRETADMLLDCGGYIGNDTGLSHLASLIVQNCVVILGGGTFRRFFPWPGQINQHVIYHGLECFDCDWHCKFRNRSCLSLVQPGDVMAYFMDVMNDQAKPECDLNPTNQEYELSWRRNPGYGRAYVRRDDRVL